MTSLTGMDIVDLIESRTGISLNPEQVQDLTVGDMKDLDKGMKIEEILKVRGRH